MKFDRISAMLLLSFLFCLLTNSQTIFQGEGTHYWDCSGMSCDLRTLKPWDQTKYLAAPEYAPVDPNDFGGSYYGESIWMTGATSDYLSASLDENDGCCGSDPDGGGGCGRCMLVTSS